MILYVNGDSHTAAAEAVNPHAFAEDDQDFIYLGRLPHPANLAVSWGRLMADTIKATFKCDAESAASNDRILRTARYWLDCYQGDTKNLLVIIQWSTWERTEWLINGTYYQINASGIDTVPDSHRDQYQKYVTEVDWLNKTLDWHEQIWTLHEELSLRNVNHVFFNGNNDFRNVPKKNRRDWGISYIGPYDDQYTYDQWLRNNGFSTVAPNSWHFGREAHAAWSRFVLQYIVDNKLI